MNSPLLFPCHNWAEKLAIAHSTELSSADCAALDAHIASCLACKAVLEEYRALDERLHQALHSQQFLQISSELLHLEDKGIGEEESEAVQGRKEEEIARRKLVFQSKHALPSSLSLVGKMFNTLAAILIIGILISGFYALHYWTHTVRSTVTGATSPIKLTLPVTPTRNPAFVRVLHASPYVGAADVYVDGTKSLSSFAFGTVTDYAAIPPGPHKVQIALVGKGVGASVITQTLSISPGLAYTVAALGSDSAGLSLEVFIDNNQLTTGKAKVRFYNLSSNSGPVVVSASNSILINELSYQSASNYLSVPEGIYSFHLAMSQSNTVKTESIAVKASIVTSIFLVGVFGGIPGPQVISTQIAALPSMPNT